MRVFKILLKKNFKFKLYNRSSMLVVALILDLFKTNNFIKK